MSVHPNVILMAVLTPDNTSRKTLREIQQEYSLDEVNDCIDIAGNEYNLLLMEEDFAEAIQIQAKEGDIVLYSLITYGYGESVSWAELTELVWSLEMAAKSICEKHRCSYEIRISANYW